MNNKPTPASQPSTAPTGMRVDKTHPERARLCATCEHEAAPDNVHPCNCCWNPLGDMYRRRVVPIAPVEQPSPARSDKDAERYSTRIGGDGEYLLFRGITLVGEIKFYADADRIVRALAGEAQAERELMQFANGEHAAERAPSSEDTARLLRAGRCLHEHARILGWTDDGEGAFEYVQRMAYELGSEDARRVTAGNAARQYQRKVDEKIIARRDAEIAELKAAGNAAPTGEKA